MAKRSNKDAAEKGFKIPIQDADDLPKSDSESQAADAHPNDALVDDELAADEPVEEGAEEGAEEGEGDKEDIVAEAEAVIDEVCTTAELEKELEKAREESAEWQNRYLRLHAEWDTYRRRTAEQREEERARATEKLMENLLPVLDDFERTVAYATENGESGLLDGVVAVQAKLLDALTKGGLKVIDPAGEAYDALEAQAVQVVPDEEAFEETVKDVFQKGYKMGKKVLRAAMVTVTSGGPQRPKEESSDEE